MERGLLEAVIFTFGVFGYTYTVTDGYKTSTGVLDINFAKVNHAPIANPDGVFEIMQDTTYSVSLASLMANDTDPDGDSISIVATPRGIDGSVVINGTNAVFTPRLGYFGTAAFDYRLADSNGAFTLGRVEFLVKPTYNPPIAVSDSGFSMVQDTVLDIDPAQLLANDIDPNHRGLTFVGFTNGPVTRLDSGLYRVTSAFNFSGALVLTYAITNDSGIQVTSTATVDVLHVPHAPTAVADHLLMTEDQPLVLNEQLLLANDFSLDSRNFAITRILNTNHVSATFDSLTGEIRIVPDLHFYGAASFDYEITDSNGLKGIGYANVDVAFVNYAPVIADISPISGKEGKAFSVVLPAGTVTDIENDPLLLTLQQVGGGALPGWLHFNPSTKTISGTPPNGVYGDFALELRADDGQLVTLKDFTLSVAREIFKPAPTIVILTDTGSSVSDGITSNAALKGTGLPNKSVTLREGSFSVTVSTDALGHWTYSGAGLVDCLHNITVTETNQVGDVGTATLVFTLDTTAPALIIALAHDRGPSGTDGITNDPALRGKADVNSFLTLSEGAFSTVVATDASGNWSYVPNGLSEGVHSFGVSQTDAAGNSSTAVLNFTLDTISPSTSIKLAHDLGGLATDRYTSDASLTGTAESNATVTVIGGGATMNVLTDANGNWNYVPVGLPDGSRGFRVTQTDLAGNTGVSTLVFTLDTQAPQPTAGLVADTGGSSSDKMTWNSALTGTADAGNFVTVSEGGFSINVSTNAGGNWTWMPSAIAQGDHTYIVSQTDFAGNIGSTSFSYTYDSVAATPLLTLAADTGVSSSDFITRNGTIVVSDLEVRTLWQYSLNGGANWTAGTGNSFTLVGDGAKTVLVNQIDVAGNLSQNGAIAFTLVTSVVQPTIGLISDTGSSASDNTTSNGGMKGIAAANSFVTLSEGPFAMIVATDASGNWNYSPTGLPDGVHSFVVTQTDIAGNSSAASLTFTLDQASAEPVLSLAIDTGASASDKITNSGVVNVAGLEPGAIWQYSLDAGVSWIPGSGTSFRVTGDGAKAVVARQTDVAGNVSNTGSLAFTLDTSVAAPSLMLAADTGSSATDMLTSMGTVNVSGLEAGAIWSYSTNGGTSWTAGTGSSFTLTGDGTKSVLVLATDVAGNVSSNAALTFTLDATAPVPTIALLNDSGATAADNITSDATSSGTAEANSVVTVMGDATILGTIIADTAGAWTFAPTGLSDGVHSFTASQTDAAGNTGTANLTVTLDRVAPVPTVALINDSGTSATDTITASAALKGTAEANSVVTVLDSATILGTAITNAAGAWTFLPVGLADGAHNFSVSQTDVAGNTGTANIAVMLDTTAVAPTATLDVDSGASPSGLIPTFGTPDFWQR